MTTFTQETFANQDVIIDGNQYDECTFDSVVLIYDGGDEPVFKDCTFRNVKIDLRGEAEQNAVVSQQLSDAGLPNEVEQVMSEVQNEPMIVTGNPEPPPAVNVGKNFSQLWWGIGISVFIAVWFFGMYAWGSVLQPMATLNDGEPLSSQVDFDLIPRLPDDLADEYDALRELQLVQLNGGVVNDDGTTSISIENAKNELLAVGFAVRPMDDEEPADTEATEEDAEEESSDIEEDSDEGEDTTEEATEESDAEATEEPSSDG